MTKREAGTIDLAKAGGAAGNLRDQCGFAKAHLSQPLAEILVSLKLTNPPGRTGGELAERGKVFKGSVQLRLRLSIRREA